MTNEMALKIIETNGWGYDEAMISKAVDKVREAMSYRTPRKPEIVKGTSLFGEAACPECGAVVYGTENACSKCGQLLDWTELQPESEAE